MSAEPKTIRVTEDTELIPLLEQAKSAPVLLERGGTLCRLGAESDEDIWAGYDPDKFREVLAEVAGSWADLDTDAMIADIYRWREEGSRPAERP
jgi:hypothetical protein